MTDDEIALKPGEQVYQITLLGIVAYALMRVEGGTYEECKVKAEKMMKHGLSKYEDHHDIALECLDVMVREKRGYVYEGLPQDCMSSEELAETVLGRVRMHYMNQECPRKNK